LNLQKAVALFLSDMRLFFSHGLFTSSFAGGKHQKMFSEKDDTGVKKRQTRWGFRLRGVNDSKHVKPNCHPAMDWL